MFIRYELRTIEVDAARAFYAKLLGYDRAVIWPLHEQARARGAMPHWLGSVGVAGVEQLDGTAEEFVTRGATVLGPRHPTPDGRHAAVLRDPGGAILGLTTAAGPSVAPAVEVSWRVLNTNHIADAVRNYETLFGWKIARDAAVGPYGTFHEFWWDTLQPRSAGAMADVAGRMGVHPHWLFFFDVESLDPAVELTRQAGGTAIDGVVTPTGERVAICEDPQRAAFGLVERFVTR